MLVTGASGGIGEAVVKSAYAHKFCTRFVLVARRKDALERVAAQLTDADCLCVIADVTKRADVVRAREAAMQKFGRIDVWMNNAGRGCTCPSFSALTDDIIDDMIAVNVKSAVYGMQEALAVMKQQQTGGQIINVASLLGRALQVNPKVPTHVRAAYAGAKAFLLATCDALRQEILLSEEWKAKIAVCTVNPGPVGTDFGVNASGPDSRGFAGVEKVEDCAEAIYQQTLVERRAEMFTREVYLPLVHAYLDRVNEKA